MRFAPLLVACALLFARPAAAQPPALDHFETKVRPVLVAHCLSCHGAKPAVKGGLNLANAAGLKAGGDSGPAIDADHPAKSLLLEVLTYDGEVKMPPRGKLPAADIAAIRQWVEAGAPFPDAEAAPAQAAANGPLFTEEQKRFWAFQPVKPAAVPAAKGDAPTAIDRFLLAKLEAAGTDFAAPADKRTLIRRATFDLTGLPPTPDEVAAFLADASPEAFARVVDRLLSSPHYGERWGRHWLDVARYADSNGLDENTGFANAWRYRDWVVRSLNADKPYAEFLTEQLAGDLLPTTGDPARDLDRRTATGYLVVGPKLLAEPDKQKMLLDIADEQLDTVTKGLMGLTLACARCHDHKFDPLPTRDYYSLLGVFTSTRTMENLNTVARAHQAAAPEPPQAKRQRELQAAAQAKLSKIEQKFGATPADDAETRQALHIEAEKERKILRWLAALTPTAVRVLCVEEDATPRNLYVQARGNYTTPREEAPPVFPRVLAGVDAKPFVATTPNPADKPAANQTRFGQLRNGSGRLELARWLADPAHPLTGRVIVNRVWAKHFGEGIVRTPDNFGRLGERPTHPELLDYLAAEFWRDGGRLKPLHRAIMLSRAYQQSSSPRDPALRERDPDNRLLAFVPRRRLEAEPIRDAMLAVAGNLDPAIGGTAAPTPDFDYISPSAKSYESPRRSLYLPVYRSKLFDFFQTFDFPEPAVPVGQRASTVVAPQALFLMNSQFVAAQSRRLAERLAREVPADGGDRVRRLFALAYGRAATDAEVGEAEAFVKRYAAKADRAKAWAALCHMVLASNEFLTAG